jgi:hypothetical protein
MFPFSWFLSAVAGYVGTELVRTSTPPPLPVLNIVSDNFRGRTRYVTDKADSLSYL